MSRLVFLFGILIKALISESHDQIANLFSKIWRHAPSAMRQYQ